MYDIIILGKGPAGISAALYTTRANLKTLVLGRDGGALAGAEKIDNYYGFPSGISGQELVERGVQQATLLGCEVLETEVLSVLQEEHFTVKTSLGTFHSRFLLIATGKARTKTKLAGVERLLGRGVSMCAVCDGFFYRNKRIAVFGVGNYALSETEELLRFTKDIVLCTNGRTPEWSAPVPDGVLVDTRPATELFGENRVEGILWQDGSRTALDGVFLAEGTASALDFAVKLGILTENNSIVVDNDYQTNNPGIYAAGDCVGGFLQISKAVADGALVARAIIKMAAKA